MVIENIRIAFGGLVSNKLRTFLSVLGILIGVMSVTLLMAVGTGASKLIDKQVSDLGANVLYVFPRTTASTVSGREPRINQADVEALLASPLSPSVQRIATALYASDTSVTAGSRTMKPSQVIGTDEEWFKVFARPATTGLSITKQDVLSRRRVVVVGATVQRKLFPGESAVGKSLRINGFDFQIIGLLQKRGGGLSGDQDGFIVLPRTAMSDTLDGAFKGYDELVVQARPGTPAGVMGKEVAAVLARQHRITDSTKYDWETFDNAQLAETTNTISLAFRGLLGLIAGISLLVGGIGVMNIMLVTVTERTREIGIRKALGAKRSHLLSQFLVEAIVLTGVGGVLGVALGAALAQIRIGPAQAILQPWMGAMAFGVSVFIGVVFGVYPANRAAKLRPIDALRYE
jgi:putative ABC transport system permease protein